MYIYVYNIYIYIHLQNPSKKPGTKISSNFLPSAKVQVQPPNVFCRPTSFQLMRWLNEPPLKHTVLG